MPDIASDPALEARVASLVAQGRRGQDAFARRSAEAERAARRAGAAGSDSWVSAQQMLSRLEAARQDTAAALAEVDALALARAAQPTSAADMARITDAADMLAALAGDQQRVIDASKARLNGR